MIKRPLLGWVVSLICGMLCFKIRLGTIIGMNVLFWILLIVWNEIKRIPIRFTKEDWHRYLWPVFFLLGFFCMLNANQISVLEMELKSPFSGKMVGEITDMVQKEKSLMLVIDDVRVYQEEKGHWIKGNQAIVYTESNQKYAIGNQLLIDGTISPLTKATNPGQFDEYSYYKSKHILCKAFAEKIEITNKKKHVGLDTLYRIKVDFTERLHMLLPEKEAGMLTAILFGDKTSMDEELKELYTENGFAHILAISGLHISILGYAVFRILKKLTLPIPICALIPCILLLLYEQMTGLSMSTKRAIFMFIFAMIATVTGRAYDSLSALSFAAIVLLLKQPLQLFQPAFLLSFGAILGIALISPYLILAVCKGKQPEEAKVNNKRVKQCWIAKDKILQSFCICSAIQLVTLPVSCYTYYELAPYSILLNLLLLPLCTILVLTGLLACLLSYLFVPLGLFLAGMTYGIFQLFEFIMKGFNRLPYHLILIGKPNLLLILLYYLILFLAFLGFSRGKNRKLLLILLSLPLCFLRIPSNQLAVTSLDVSQGECMIVTLGDTCILIDGGSTDCKEVYRYRIKPYLKSRGIKTIRAVFVTHADSDHTSGIVELLSEMNRTSNQNGDYNGELFVEQLILTDVAFMEEWQELVVLAKEKRVPITYVGGGDIVEAATLQFRVLSPVRNVEYESLNDTSMVLWLKKEEIDALFTGDISSEVENDLMKQYYEDFLAESFEFLKVPHHGSKYSCNPSFDQLIQPKCAVISAGKNNRYGHPHEITVQTLRKLGTKVYVTKEIGAVRIRLE